MNIGLFTHKLQHDRPEQVVETIESPDQILPGDNGEEIAIKKYGDREIRVVYEETDVDRIVIYTVMKSRIRF